MKHEATSFTPAVVEMDVRGDGQNWLPGRIDESTLIEIFGHVENSQSSVDDKIAISSFHHPNVGAIP